MRTLGLMAILLALTAIPLHAEERSWELIGWATFVSTDADHQIEGAPDRDVVRIQIDDSWGLGLGANFYFGNRWSIEVAATIVEPDFIITEMQDSVAIMINEAGTKMIPISLTLQYHFQPEGPWDPYIGVGGSWTFFEDLDHEDDFDQIPIDRIDFDDRAGLVLNAGIHYELSHRFGLNLDAKYVPLSSSAKVTFSGSEVGETDISVNPLILAAGVSIRF
ncbi:MAG TPA: OmpW family outer membrane protein [Thermoanaerobaculia bacterium]|nr:OmpW family outer membrane protein [Thermoanaerobaculia bacterium]